MSVLMDLTKAELLFKLFSTSYGSGFVPRNGLKNVICTRRTRKICEILLLKLRSAHFSVYYYITNLSIMYILCLKVRQIMILSQLLYSNGMQGKSLPCYLILSIIFLNYVGNFGTIFAKFLLEKF